uniref:DUF5857 domain-containing protein n=1 Tax=Steinernema glaseri TaxID=37863 RepID=A0A1I7ZNJ3_9BILA
MAFNEKRIGYRIRIKDEDMTCSLLTDFNRFEASQGLETSEVHDYILATNVDDKMCSANATRNGIPLEKDRSVLSVNVRYVYLGSRYVGQFAPEESVESVDDCSSMAFNEKRIGYRIRTKDEDMTCSLLIDFSRFEASEGIETSEVHDYILATNVDDKMCSANATRNVSDFLSKPCDPGASDCALLEKIADYCRFVGSDVLNCVSPTLTLRDLECPVGQERVNVKKGKRLCCPVGEKLAEERDGKTLCCPQKKELKDVVNGKAICCALNENHKKGTTLCCPSGHIHSNLSSIERTLSKSSNGALGCCPQGEHFEKREGGVDHCCPDGEHLELVKDGEAVCCWDGSVLKGFYKGKKMCCKDDTTFHEDDGWCCPPGYLPSKAADGFAGCCKAEFGSLVALLLMADAICWQRL